MIEHALIIKLTPVQTHLKASMQRAFPSTGPS
jgi:hypothetical protein